MKPLAFISVFVITLLSCCRPKQSGASGYSNGHSSPQTEIPNPKGSGPAEAPSGWHDKEQTKHPPVESQVLDSNSTLYGAFRRELFDVAMQTPSIGTREEYQAYLQVIRKTLDRRRLFLFAIPVSPQAEQDRLLAWNTLDLAGVVSDAQVRYVKGLANAYSESPQIEKLVMWEVVRTRLDFTLATGGMRGDAFGESLLRIEMARLLFSALGIDVRGLFEAVELKQRSLNDAAEKKASEAEDEIKKMQIEASKVAEQILEKHWKALPPRN